MSKQHEIVIKPWDKINQVMKELQDQGCEIINVGPVREHAAFVFYSKNPVRVQAFTKRKPAVDKSAIEAAYQNYPRKIGRKAGITKAIQLCQEGLSVKDLEKAIENFANFVKGRDTNKIPYFSTFMNSQIDDFLPENYSPEKASSRYELL